MKITYAQGIAMALTEALAADPNVLMIGSGFMGLSPSARDLLNPLLRDYPERIFVTPISELGLAGAAIGAAACGQRPVVDLGTGSFILEAFAQVVNEAANIHYMTGGQTTVPVTFFSLAGIRGAGAAQHSGRMQAMLGNTPGLQVLAPGAADDAYGLLKWALLESRNPSVFLAHSLIFDDSSDIVRGEPMLPVGKARIRREGKDVTIVASSIMVPRALAAAEALARDSNVSAEVLDLRTIVPLDRAAIIASVAKTGRAVIADECPYSFGVAAEIAATLAEHAFAHLKAPVLRVAVPDVPIPFSPPLEAELIVTSEKIAAAAAGLVKR